MQEALCNTLDDYNSVLGNMRCLVQFSQEFHWINFRFAELDSLLLMNGIDPITAYTRNDSNDATLDAFLCIELPGLDVAKAMCERSILIKGIYELWCHDSTVSRTIEKAKSLPRSFQEPHMGIDKSWSINVDVHCKSYSMSDKERCRNNFKFLDFKGKVNLDNAEVQMWVLLDYSQQSNSNEVSTFSQVSTITRVILFRIVALELFFEQKKSDSSK